MRRLHTLFWSNPSRVAFGVGCATACTGLVGVSAYNQQSIPQPKYTHNNLNVLVTSTNPQKIESVKTAFEEWFSDNSNDNSANKTNKINVRATGMKSKSGIFHGQPWGLQHTFEGARARIEYTKKDCKDKNINLDNYTHIVSVENGISTVLTHESLYGFDVAVVIIQDFETNEQQVAVSQARPYPIETVQKMARSGVPRKEIGRFCHKYYQELPLTISREEQIIGATKMALSQFSQI